MPKLFLGQSKRQCARSSMDRASDYGSEGWGVRVPSSAQAAPLGASHRSGLCYTRLSPRWRTDLGLTRPDTPLLSPQHYSFTVIEHRFHRFLFPRCHPQSPGALHDNLPLYIRTAITSIRWKPLIRSTGPFILICIRRQQPASLLDRSQTLVDA